MIAGARAMPTGGYLHLDLLKREESTIPSAVAQGLRWYVDVTDPTVFACLDERAPARDDDAAGGCHEMVLECLAGDVVVDTAATARSRHLFVVLFPVPSSDLPLLDEWFGLEHAPMLLQVAGWARARLVAVDAGPVTRVAVHELEDLAALNSPKRQQAGVTEWTRRVLASEWARSLRRHVLRAV